MRDPLPQRATSTMAGDRSGARIEESVGRLPSVAAAHVVEAGGGSIDRVHVVAAPGWAVDTVLRDVHALLQQRFGLDLPSDRLRVEAQLQGAGTPSTTASEAPTPGAAPMPEEQAAPLRLVLDTVHLALRAAGTSVGVDLLRGGQRLRGTTGPVGAVSVLTAVVAATLDAMREQVTHALEPVVAEVVQAGGDQIAVATIDASDGRSRQRLTGSALVRGNIEDAMARATLDATNRLLVRD